MTKRQCSLLMEFLFWFGIGLIAFLLTFTFNDTIALYHYGANRWPAGIAVILMACASMQYGYYLFHQSVKEEEKEDNEYCIPLRKMWSMFAIPIGYVLLIPYIGFYAGTIIFLPIYSWSVSRENLLKTLVICDSVACLLVVIFTKLLFVPFPVGTLPLFYQFNSEIVKLLY